MRIDKLLAHSGFGTRKEVKQLIKKSIVQVNDEIIKSPKVHINPDGDTIFVGGEPVHYQEFVYFMLNKPTGVISATEDQVHETVVDLLEPADVAQEPHPVGRLDIDTEGLLILTNDGKLTHLLTSPNRKVDKWYLAHISGIITEEDETAFKQGVTLDDGYQTMPAELKVLAVDHEDNVTKVEIVVQEGKFHQVKRMVKAIGKEVFYLKRTAMGNLKLDEQLELGTYKELTKDEIKLLKES